MVGCRCSAGIFVEQKAGGQVVGLFSRSKSSSSSNQGSAGAQSQTGEALATDFLSSKNNTVTTTINREVTDFDAVDRSFAFGESALASTDILANEVLRRDQILSADALSLVRDAITDGVSAVSDNSRASFQTVADALNYNAKSTGQAIGSLSGGGGGSGSIIGGGGVNPLLWIAAAVGALLLYKSRGK